MQLKNTAPSIFKRLVNDIIDGAVTLDEEFNQAFLSCIPKAADERTSDGQPIHTAASARPLSIVDAAKRDRFCYLERIP